MRIFKGHLSLLSVLLVVACIAVGGTERGHTRYRPRPRKPVIEDEKSVEFDLRYDFSVPGETSRVKFLVLVPKSIPDRQKILSVRCRPKPSRMFSENGNRYAEFEFAKPKKRFSVNVRVRAELYRYDLATARKKRNREVIEHPDLEEFLVDERLIRKDDESIQAAAEEIEGRTPQETVKKIYDYVLDTLDYSGLFEEEFGAVAALEEKKGDCTEYSDLFTALCRAKGVAARVVTGYTVRHDSIPPKHHWVEVYFEKFGWVPFDPSWGEAERASFRNRGFDTMKPVYIYLSGVRNDEKLHNKHFYTYSYWGDKVQLKDSITFKKSEGDSSKSGSKRRYK